MSPLRQNVPQNIGQKAHRGASLGCQPGFFLGLSVSRVFRSADFGGFRKIYRSPRRAKAGRRLCGHADVSVAFLGARSWASGDEQPDVGLLVCASPFVCHFGHSFDRDPRVSNRVHAPAQKHAADNGLHDFVGFGAFGCPASYVKPT